MKAPRVGRKRGRQRLTPVPAPLRPKKPVRGKGPAKPPSRERRKPVPFPGSPPRGGGRIQPGRPAKPPTRGRRKPVPMPIGPRPGDPRQGTVTPRPASGSSKPPKAPRPKVIKETKTGPVKKRPLPKPIKETKGGPAKRRRKLAQPRPINPTGRVSYRGPRMIRRR